VKVANSGRLKVMAPAPLPKELIEQLRAAKPDLLSLLASAEPQTGLDGCVDAGDERAAIVEYDASAPRAWAEALARLDPNKPPADVPPIRWVRFIDDCAHFLDSGWVTRAIALGWGPLELFGCDRERPLARLDNAGLLWLLNGRKLVALSANAAVIETLTGRRHTYHRCPAEVGRIGLAWEQNP
jgi:hypothetical protein